MAGNSNVIQTICTAYDGLSKTDQRIASFILENSSTVPDMQMKEIAEGSQTSSPTVSRFIRRIGYENFDELRLALARSESSRRSNESIIGKSTGTISTDRFHESLNYILSCKTAELAETVAQIDEQTITDVIELLHGARGIMVAGVGNTRTLADNMAFKLRHLGLRAVSFATPNDSIQFAATMNDQDAIVIISSSGISRRLSRLANLAQELCVPIILITSNPRSPLIERAAHVIMSIQQDRLFAYGLPFSHNSVNFIIEVLFLFIHANYPDVREHVARRSVSQDDFDRLLDLKTGEFKEMEHRR